MAKILNFAGVLALVLVIALGVKVFLPSPVNFGAAGNMLAENYDPYIRYNGGFNTSLPVNFGSTTTAVALTVTTSDTATSTSAVGCIQTTATSTLTPIRLVIGSSGATTTYRGTSSNGVVGWQYGTCP